MTINRQLSIIAGNAITPLEAVYIAQLFATHDASELEKFHQWDLVKRHFEEVNDEKNEVS